MGKIKTPLLSLGARGTLGDTTTFTRRHKTNIVMKKPVPAYRYTLPQAYQRWLYEDYAYLWRQQSAATQATYRSAGVRFHLTGFQYWMKYHLTNLPDIVAWWKLDYVSASTTPDSSRNAITGTVVGATPSLDGRIGSCLSFDGLNDRVFLGDPPTTIGLEAISIEAFVYPTAAVGNHEVVEQRERGFMVEAPNAGSRIYFRIQGTLGSKSLTSPAGVILPDVWQHVACVYDTPNLYIYRNGVLVDSEPLANLGPLTATPDNLYIGCYNATAGWYLGLIDDVIIRNRVLTPTEALRHSLRRYPP